MPKYTTKITKEWGEIGFGSSKREGYSWEVVYLVDGKQIDKACYKTERFAHDRAGCFENGDWKYSEWQGVDFDV